MKPAGGNALFVKLFGTHSLQGHIVQVAGKFIKIQFVLNLEVGVIN
jgi:hypothetical protein